MSNSTLESKKKTENGVTLSMTNRSKQEEPEQTAQPAVEQAASTDAAAEAAGRNDGGGLAELGLHALDHAVEHGGRAVDTAGAHGLDRVGADALFRRVERDVRQLRRAACERLE